MPDPVALVLAFPLRSTGAGCDPELFQSLKPQSGRAADLGGLSYFCTKRGPVPRHSNDHRAGSFRSPDDPSTFDLRPMILLSARARQGKRQVARRVHSTFDETCLEIVTQPGVTNTSTESSAVERSLPSLTGIQGIEIARSGNPFCICSHDIHPTFDAGAANITKKSLSETSVLLDRHNVGVG